MASFIDLLVVLYLFFFYAPQKTKTGKGPLLQEIRVFPPLQLAAPQICMHPAVLRKKIFYFNMFLTIKRVCLG